MGFKKFTAFNICDISHIFSNKTQVTPNGQGRQMLIIKLPNTNLWSLQSEMQQSKYGIYITVWFVF